MSALPFVALPTFVDFSLTLNELNLLLLKLIQLFHSILSIQPPKPPVECLFEKKESSSMLFYAVLCYPMLSYPVLLCLLCNLVDRFA